MNLKKIKKNDRNTVNLEKEKNVVNNNKNLSSNINKKRLYFSFNFRFITLLISFIICSIVSFLLIMMSFSIISERTIDYQEKSDIDYRVYLKENEFYDEEYLKEDMVYVSSLIKNIEADFKYSFNINFYINLDLHGK